MPENGYTQTMDNYMYKYGKARNKWVQLTRAVVYPGSLQHVLYRQPGENLTMV